MLDLDGVIQDDQGCPDLEFAWNDAAEVDPATYHLFSGDAMVHGLSLRDGKAQWYRNRWVRTPSTRPAGTCSTLRT